MNLDLAFGVIVYLWDKVNENSHVLIPILVFTYMTWTKRGKGYAYGAEELISRLDELQGETYINNEEYRKRILTKLLLYVAELIEGVRVAVAALLAILVFLLLSPSN